MIFIWHISIDKPRKKISHEEFSMVFLSISFLDIFLMHETGTKSFEWAQI